MSKFEHKVDFVAVVAVNNANPNGDPLNGNRPRTDYEGYGEISNGLFAYVPAYDNYEFEIVLFDGDNKTINYKALDTVIDMLVNGEKIK